MVKGERLTMSIEQVLDEIEQAHNRGKKVSLELSDGRYISLQETRVKQSYEYTSVLTGGTGYEKLKMLLDVIYDVLEQRELQVERIKIH